ncbi:MAG: hypothetical protein KGD64_01215 [Candidatus Heimdallarchaeota archaeon]|nr:hypothetical protein [Candidatus Heimdallarchaeota archaeon]
MSVALYIGIGVTVFLGGVSLIVYFSLKKRKKTKNPVLERAEDTIVILTQRIHKMDKRIKVFDEDVTKLVIAKEKEGSTLTEQDINLEDIQTKIENNKKEINDLIADIKDLRNYKTEIENLSKSKKHTGGEELEKLLDVVKEKLQYRFI